MTFGMTLKQMLVISGVKSAGLAEALGYDSSYISRWINDIKLPSQKNNDIFDKIAAFVTGNSSDAAKRELASIFADGDMENLRPLLAESLSIAYNNSVPGSSMSGMNTNAVIVPGTGNQDDTELYVEAIFQSAIERKGQDVNCLSTTPLSRYSNRNRIFWSRIMNHPRLRGNVSVTMHQLVNEKDAFRDPERCCAALCTYAEHVDKVRYEFYWTEKNLGGDCVVVEDRFLSMNMKNPLNEKEDKLICMDREALSGYRSVYSRELAQMDKLLRRVPSERLIGNHFLYDYVMDGGLLYFLNTMHPIYLSESLADSLFKKYVYPPDDNEFQLHYNNLCANVSKKVIVYRSAVLDYIYGGSLHLFGRMLEIDKADRTAHLEELLDNMSQGKCELAIVNDNNPLLCREDMKLSVYLSRSMGFAVPLHGKPRDYFFQLGSYKSVELFRGFFDRFYALDPEYVLCGSEAEKFIRRGLELI